MENKSNCKPNLSITLDTQTAQAVEGRVSLLGGIIPCVICVNVLSLSTLFLISSALVLDLEAVGAHQTLNSPN